MREWRGKIAVGSDMVHQRLSDLMQDGAALVVERVTDGSTVEPSHAAGWPVALIGASGTFTLFSPDDDDVTSAGDLIVRLCQPALLASLAAPRRRFGLPRRATA